MSDVVGLGELLDSRGLTMIYCTVRLNAGEITLQFLKSGDPSCRDEISYGDGGLYMKLVVRKGVRTLDTVSSRVPPPSSRWYFPGFDQFIQMSLSILTGDLQLASSRG